jgi:acyl-CoA reductase-like NAD-dependent aldehyde dehydrogenase
MSKYLPYVAGRFIETENDISVTEKFTRSEFTRVGLCDSFMLEQAISEAVNARKIMSVLSSAKKAEILQFVSARLLNERGHFAEIIAKEAGKPVKYARIEVERAAQTFFTAAEEAKRIHSEVISLDWFSHGAGKEAIVKLFPVGVVAGITPFNFPLNLVAHKVAPAIAAGCPILLKPASATPVSALELARIIHESGLPQGAFSVLPMTHQVGNQLIEDERIQKISFTGSQDVGWKMKARCGKKRITLELGGNAAAIVTSSADMYEAIAKCVTGAFAYSGQVCIHTQRIFVHEDIYKTFLSGFTERAGQWKAGNPLDLQTDISVLIDEANAIRVEHWIKEAVHEGAVVAMGGGRNGCFVEPTVMTNTTADMKIRKEEVFGPVVTIEQYKHFSDAVNMVNDSCYGLQAGVFTNRIDEMNQAFREIEVGGVLINESPTFRIDHMPYGGIKDSGFGREGVKFAIHEMSEMKLLMKPV